MYLLDTNIISEGRKPRPNPDVIHWLSHLDKTQVFISVVAIGEIQMGIEKVRLLDSEKAARIEVWLEELMTNEVILQLDAKTMRLWGQLKYKQPPRQITRHNDCRNSHNSRINHRYSQHPRL